MLALPLQHCNMRPVLSHHAEYFSKFSSHFASLYFRICEKWKELEAVQEFERLCWQKGKTLKSLLCKTYSWAIATCLKAHFVIFWAVVHVAWEYAFNNLIFVPPISYVRIWKYLPACRFLRSEECFNAAVNIWKLLSSFEGERMEKVCWLSLRKFTLGFQIDSRCRVDIIQFKWFVINLIFALYERRNSRI